jgi:GT2 family glycosyltransferase
MPFVCFKRLGERRVYSPRSYAKSFEKILRVGHCISACWLVRRKALGSVGLLDENIFYAPEDIDYCLQMWLSGWEVLYVPFARVLHYTQRSSYKSFRMAWLHGKGLFFFFRKHKYLLSRKNLYKKIIRAVKQHGIQQPEGLN